MPGERGGKRPTATKWVECNKTDENGRVFVRCRLVARDAKPRREGIRDDMFAAMPPLEAKKMLFALVAGERERRKAQGKAEEKIMLIDVFRRYSTNRIEKIGTKQLKMRPRQLEIFLDF